MPLFLLLLVSSLAGIQVVEGGSGCQAIHNGAGSFDPAQQKVSLCSEVARRKQRSMAEVARHELFHGLQHQFGREQGFLPDALLTPLVRQFMDDREVMAVLSLYPDDDINAELEARLASRFLPNGVLAGGLVAGALVVSEPSQAGAIGSLRAFLLGE